MNVYTYDYLMKNGRLGNQLFQIAATIGFAKQNNGIARFNPNWEYRSFFCIPDEYFEDISGYSNVIDGNTEYFQKYSFIEPVKDIIQEYFQPSDSARKTVQDLWCNKFYYFVGRKVLGLHVRRGDYLKTPNHFPIMSSHYFQTAVHDVLDTYGNDLCIIVFSDEIDWCKRHIDYLGLDLLEQHKYAFMEGVVRPVEVIDRVGQPEDWIDLHLMSMCDQIVLSNSTFSWWGAWLSKSTNPIYPSQWWGREIPNYLEWELIIPPGWRKFNC